MSDGSGNYQFSRDCHGYRNGDGDTRAHSNSNPNASVAGRLESTKEIGLQTDLGT
jgi:hypothetical protein